MKKQKKHTQKTPGRKKSTQATRESGAQATRGRDAQAGRERNASKHSQGALAGRERNASKHSQAAQAGRKIKTQHQQPAKNTSLCAVSAKCGACSLLDMPYDKQLELKHNMVKDLFAGLLPEDVQVNKPLGMESPYHYRSKVTSPFAPGKKLAAGTKAADERHLTHSAPDSKHTPTSKLELTPKHAPRNAKRAHNAAAKREILTGMYAAHSHKLVPTTRCLLENEQAKQVILAIKSIMGRFNIEPYNEDTGRGFLRHAMVRTAHRSGEVLVTLVTNAHDFPSSRSFCRELIKRCPFITTVVQNINLRQTNVILGEEERTLYGPGFILDELCGLSFRISSTSFYQVNTRQTEVLYNCAIDLAHLSGTELAIDAYCGTGTIGLVAAKRGAKSVIGIDNVASAIADARNNASHNGIKNTQFSACDAGEFMRALAKDGDLNSAAAPSRATQPDHAAQAAPPTSAAPSREDIVLFMDPPRAGASKEFLESACVLAPDRIVYISCNPQTQARDVAYLAHAGYEIRAIQPVDMFPHTKHIETVCLLVRKNS